MEIGAVEIKYGTAQNRVGITAQSAMMSALPGNTFFTVVMMNAHSAAM
jgi:hypothetical protein